MKIFWIHPKLMDYRLKYFEEVHQKHEVLFYFQEASAIENKLNYLVSKKGKILKGVKINIFWSDIITIIKNIYANEIVISSFVLQTYSIIAIIFTKLLNKKIIIWEEIIEIQNSRKARIKYKFMKLLSGYVDAYFVMGKTQKETLLKLNIESNKIFVSNEYPSIKYHDIDPKKIPLPFDESKKVILYIGRFVEFKGIEYLIKAFKEINADQPDTVLLIVGDGPLKEKLINLVKMLRINDVHIYPFISDLSEKAYIYKIAKVVVVPSIIGKNGETEGGPLVVLEALSAGRPIVGSDKIGSSKEFIIEGENGFIVPQKDIVGLKEKICLSIKMSSEKESNIIKLFNSIQGYEYQANILDNALYSIS